MRRINVDRYTHRGWTIRRRYAHDVVERRPYAYYTATSPNGAETLGYAFTLADAVKLVNHYERYTA